MLARALVPDLRSRGWEVVALDRAALDVADEAAVHGRIRDEEPDVVVQCAAYTAVDAAEADEAAASRINAGATRYVGEVCQRIGARLVYPSTDYVFQGSASRPYQPYDPPNPLNAYGRSKLDGERATLEVQGGLVVRTSWLYGSGGSNFVDNIQRLARERDHLDVVSDQIGRPTWTVSLARAVCALLERRSQGILHVTDGGEPVSWYDFARAILAETALETAVRAVPSSAFPRPAARPSYSVLDCAATEAVLGHPLPAWREMLTQYLHGDGSDV
jgi:dTDP-4-dehydrorhamnose reductase